MGKHYSLLELQWRCSHNLSRLWSAPRTTKLQRLTYIQNMNSIDNLQLSYAKQKNNRKIGLQPMVSHHSLFTTQPLSKIHSDPLEICSRTKITPAAASYYLVPVTELTKCEKPVPCDY